MANGFKFDVFLSHSSKDKLVVCELAERWRADGPGIQRLAFSLQPSHDAPLNKERRFIPLRLDCLACSKQPTLAIPPYQI